MISLAPNSMAPVEWSNLPSELVGEISAYLRSATDQLRLRSVCSSWRAALPCCRPPSFPVIPNNGFYPSYPNDFSVMRHTSFLLSPPTNPNSNSNSNSTPWLLNIEENLSGNNFHLLNPFSMLPVNRLPISFPYFINFSDIRISELYHEYILQFTHDNALRHKGRNFYSQKVAYLPRGDVCDDFAVLTIQISGKLAMFRSVDQQWNIINDIDSQYNDIVCFNGEFYAVDNTGRTVVVSPDSGDVVAVVAWPLSSNGIKNHLVQIGKELILVVVSHKLPLIESDEEDEDEGRWPSKWFEVFKLDRNDGKWVETDNLENRVLFLGDNYAFSASASDLKCKGNYICYIDSYYPWDKGDDYEVNFQGLQVFDIKEAMVKYYDHSSYLKLFWPVPSWISITT